MCFPAIAAAVGAVVPNVGTALAIAGTAISVGGSLMQASQASAAHKAQAAHYEQQAKNETALAAVSERRARAQMRSQMRRQTAELAARGIQLDSPVAVMLGETAAREMSFEGQAIRSGGQARRQELSASAQMSRAMATEATLTGRFSAAGSFLKSAPEIWPGLLT